MTMRKASTQYTNQRGKVIGHIASYARGSTMVYPAIDRG